MTNLKKLWYYRDFPI